MIDFATIARPYAKALFEIAKKQQQVESWLEGLSLLAKVMTQPDMLTFVGRVDIDTDKKVTEIISLLHDTKAIDNSEFRNFLSVVAVEKRLEVLPEIFEQYQNMFLSDQHMKQAKIYTAYDIVSEGQRAKIISDLEQYFQVRLQATFETNNELIGGIKVVMGDQVLDLSVQGKLQELYTAMIN